MGLLSRVPAVRGAMQWKYPLRALGLAAAAGACNCAYTAHYYRPIPHFPGDDYTPSKRRLLDVGNEPPALLLARQVTLMVGTLVSKGIMGAMNSLVIVDDDRYQAWLKARCFDEQPISAMPVALGSVLLRAGPIDANASEGLRTRHAALLAASRVVPVPPAAGARCRHEAGRGQGLQ